MKRTYCLIWTLKSAKAIILEPLVEGKHLQMELDTGASVSVIPQKIWEEKFSEVKLETSTMVLKTYTGEALQVLGEAAVKVQYGKQEAKLPVVVVSGNGPALLGRNWLHAINPLTVKRAYMRSSHIPVKALVFLETGTRMLFHLLIFKFYIEYALKRYL